jgi:drug/metabolite transporter (DMT)-like permease
MKRFVGSIKKNQVGILLILISSITLAIGQFYWKISSGHLLIPLLFGFAIYIIGAISMIFAYRYGSFSVLHPMMSFSYVFAFILGFFFLNEVASMAKIGGLVLIIIGIVLIGGGDDQ